MGGAFGLYGEARHDTGWWENLKVKRPQEGRGIDGSILLNGP